MFLQWIHSFKSQRICQDPFEQFFGMQRQRGGVHENPNVVEFSTNTQALHVVNSFCHAPSRGNCRGGENPNVVEFSTNTQALHVVNSFCHAPSRGNCRGGVSEQDVLLRPLPKCSRFSFTTADGNPKNRVDVTSQTPPGNLNQF